MFVYSIHLTLINSLNLKCEPTVIKNMVKEINYENIKQYLNDEVFPGLYKIMQVTVFYL